MSRRTTTAEATLPDLLQRALNAFNTIADVHRAIGAQLGGVWQLAYSEGDEDDQGRAEALLVCREKLDRVVAQMLCELADALEAEAGRLAV